MTGVGAEAVAADAIDAGVTLARVVADSASASGDSFLVAGVVLVAVVTSNAIIVGLARGRVWSADVIR